MQLFDICTRHVSHGKVGCLSDFLNYYGSAVWLLSSQQICKVLQASVEIYVRELNLSSHSCANV